MKIKSKKYISRNNVKKFGLKLLWFGFMLVTVGITGTVVCIVLWAIDNPADKGDLIASVTLASIILSSLIVLLIWLLSKSKKTLLRWIRKSFVILVPMIFVVLFITVIGLSQIKESDIQFESQAGLAGTQAYFDGLEFTNEKLWNATNEERTKNNKPALTLNTQLNDSALRKCQDMVARNYWSHDDPDGRGPWHFISEVNYDYDTAGENLAYGFVSEDDTVTGWMNSEGHRNNLLGDYKEVGFGTCKSDNYINHGRQLVVVQHFASPTSSIQISPKPSQSTPPPQPKPYVASVCTKTPIPYQIRYEDVTYLYVGETRDYGGGIDGYTETCTPDSMGYKPPDFTIQPYSKTIYRGTKPLPPSPSM